MKTTTLLGAIALACGCTADVRGQVTVMTVETSLDGITWAAGQRDVAAGSTVQVRYKVSFDAAGSTSRSVGFASLTFQPTISHWADDTLLPFATIGNNGSGGGVTNGSGLFGRIIPFAATGPTTSDPYRGHVQSVDGVSSLRIARSSITNWIGTGATSGTAAANNFNGAGGIACVQKGFGSVGPSDPPFNAATTGVVLAKFGLTLSGDPTPRTLTLGVPVAGMSRNATTGMREAGWYASNTDLLGSIKTLVEVTPASLAVRCSGVPAFSQHPTGGRWTVGRTVTLACITNAGDGGSYRWRRDGMELQDDATLSGTSTPTLTIRTASLADAGAYSLAATTFCGTSVSNVARVELRCVADFTTDGGVDGLDVAAFFHEWEAGGLEADVNEDGGMDGADVVTFFERWEVGC